MHKFEVDAFQGDLKETTLPCLHVLHWKLASQLWPYTHGEKTHCGERKKKRSSFQQQEVDYPKIQGANWANFIEMTAKSVPF